ncbi:UPF0481 protein At3g47200-like [Diospyros lotus]|uniref:UPF0481 protein At3g47200-like n=1 Tax=Diospyros lotus TaxID=55363 RepID=UPI0022573E6E|nr:UPF0481 protein At3g47200-like [Diospyros lotus]
MPARTKEQDPVAIRINDRLDKLRSDSSSNRGLSGVHDRLHKVNPVEPVILAVGPRFHGRRKLQEMEKQKFRYFKQLVERNINNMTGLNEYVNEIRGLEARAREFYQLDDQMASINSDDLAEILLIDGCFIVELLRKYKNRAQLRGDDPIFRLDQLRFVLRRDLILLENQLPFFVLDHLFRKTRGPGEEDHLIPLALAFLEQIMPNQKLEVVNYIGSHEVKHLLGLVHSSWGHRFVQALGETNRVSQDDVEDIWEFIESATELKEAGVELKMMKSRSNLFSIQFNKKTGVLEMPCLCIGDYTQFPLRNLLAYEQDHLQADDQPKYVGHYLAFINCLVQSPKDVQLLRQKRVIESWLGDDAAVYNMLKGVYRFVLISAGNYSYSRVCMDVNHYCKRHRDDWMTKLKIGGGFLLFLTLVQTLFTIVSCFKGN